MFADKGPCERMVVHLDHDSLAEPLPKLTLGGPKLLSVSADNQGRSLLPSKSLLQLFD